MQSQSEAAHMTSQVSQQQQQQQAAQVPNQMQIQVNTQPYSNGVHASSAAQTTGGSQGGGMPQPAMASPQGQQNVQMVNMQQLPPGTQFIPPSPQTGGQPMIKMPNGACFIIANAAQVKSPAAVPHNVGSAPAAGMQPQQQNKQQFVQTAGMQTNGSGAVQHHQAPGALNEIPANLIAMGGNSNAAAMLQAQRAALLQQMQQNPALMQRMQAATPQQQQQIMMQLMSAQQIQRQPGNLAVNQAPSNALDLQRMVALQQQQQLAAQAQQPRPASGMQAMQQTVQNLLGKGSPTAPAPVVPAVQPTAANTAAPMDPAALAAARERDALNFMKQKKAEAERQMQLLQQQREQELAAAAQRGQSSVQTQQQQLQQQLQQQAKAVLTQQQQFLLQQQTAAALKQKQPQPQVPEITTEYITQKHIQEARTAADQRLSLLMTHQQKKQQAVPTPQQQDIAAAAANATSSLQSMVKAIAANVVGKGEQHTYDAQATMQQHAQVPGTDEQHVIAPPPPPVKKEPRPAPKEPRAAPKMMGRPGADPHTWSVGERDALRRAVNLFGIGRWAQLHSAVQQFFKGFAKSEEDVADATWHLIQALEEFILVPDDKAFLQQQLLPIADRGQIITPGAPWTKLNGSLVKRLRVLDEIKRAMALLQQPAVYGAWLAGLAQSEAHHVASYWTVRCDVGLIYGCWKHGYANYDEMRKDPEYAHVFNIQTTAAEEGAEVAAGPGAPNAEQLTRRYRKLLDWIFKAEKTAAIEAEKAAKEAEEAARKAEDAAKRAARAAKAAAEKEAREAAARQAAEEKAAARRLKQQQVEAREQARRQAAESMVAAESDMEDDERPHGGRRRKKKRADDEYEGWGDDDDDDELGIGPASPPKPKKQKAAAAAVRNTYKNPDEMAAKHVSELVKVLMTWGIPLHMDWAGCAASLPAPAPIQATDHHQAVAQPNHSALQGHGTAGGNVTETTLLNAESSAAAVLDQDMQMTAHAGNDNAKTTPVQGPGPVMDRTAAVTACINGIQASLGFSERIAGLLAVLPVTTAWTHVRTVHDACEVIRKLNAPLSGRSNVALQHTLLDILADLHAVEEGAAGGKKKGGAGQQAGGGLSRPVNHSDNCKCAVCCRVRQALEKKKQAQEAATGKEGEAEDAKAEQADKSNNVEAAPEAESDQDEGGDEAPDDTPEDDNDEPASAKAATAANTATVKDGAQGIKPENADAEHGQQGGPQTGAAAGKENAPEQATAAPKAPPALRLLSQQVANRLRERVLSLLQLHAGHELLKPQWQEQAVLVNRLGDLPVWWEPKHDGDLVAGVLCKGFGEWTPILDDASAAFLGSQQQFIDRQLAKRAAARRIKAGEQPADGQPEIAQDEVDALAELPDDAPVVGSAMPLPAALVKRCRQIAACMLRLLRKEKYLKVAKKHKQEGEEPGEGTTPRNNKTDPMLKAQALAIAMEVLQGGGGGAAADTDSKPAAKDGDTVSGSAAASGKAVKAGAKRGRKPASAAADDKQDPVMKAEALRIALEVMAGTGGAAGSTAAPTKSAGTATDNGTSVAKAATTVDDTATERTLGAPEPAQIRSDAQSPQAKAPKQRKRKEAAAGGEASSDAVKVVQKKAKKASAKAGSVQPVSDLARQIALSAMAAASGAKAAENVSPATPGGPGSSATVAAALQRYKQHKLTQQIQQASPPAQMPEPSLATVGGSSAGPSQVLGGSEATSPAGAITTTLIPAPHNKASKQGGGRGKQGVGSDASKPRAKARSSSSGTQSNSTRGRGRGAGRAAAADRGSGAGRGRAIKLITPGQPSAATTEAAAVQAASIEANAADISMQMDVEMPASGSPITGATTDIAADTFPTNVPSGSTVSGSQTASLGAGDGTPDDETVQHDDSIADVFGGTKDDELEGDALGLFVSGPDEDEDDPMLMRDLAGHEPLPSDEDLMQPFL